MHMGLKKLAQAKYIIKNEKFAIAVHVLQKNEFVILGCCFAGDGKEIYKDSKRTCRTIVQLIETFVW